MVWKEGEAFHLFLAATRGDYCNSFLCNLEDRGPTAAKGSLYFSVEGRKWWQREEHSFSPKKGDGSS
ncbi:hypothetical protein MA16_Dca006795 [Dendrobium catenatum]|uniref:Uncharacterized protein n=1 Tax=Dendrobium catenatum TaxID=906689 RepID=A0A2I0W974_9ASPA|nr:hypothetical protein MA16_Dca006795 [Dendrobium catenatum]